MKNFTKINQEVFEHEFCNVLRRFQNIQTDSSKNKFSADSPLGFFLEREKVKSMQQIVYDEFQHINDEASLAYISYKERTAVELSVTFQNLDQAVFTIKEILLAAPNTKDEENFAQWYPFKSTIIAYVDFEEILFNLQMMVNKNEIKVLKRNDRLASTETDKSLLTALTNKFNRVLISR